MKKFFTLVCLGIIATLSSCSHKIYDNTKTYGNEVNVKKAYTEVQHDTLTMHMFRQEVDEGTLPSLDKWIASSYVEGESRVAHTSYAWYSSELGKIMTMKQVIEGRDTLLILQVRSIQASK